MDLRTVWRLRSCLMALACAWALPLIATGHAHADDASMDSCQSPELNAAFERTSESKLHGAAGLGCEVRLVEGCLRLRCLVSPDSAEFTTYGKQSNTQQLAMPRGQLTLPFARGERVQIKLDYARAEEPYGVRVLDLSWPAGAAQAPEWLGRMRRVDNLFTREMTRNCRDILRSQTASATAGLSKEDKKSLPSGWNTCQPGPTGAWMAFLDRAKPVECDHGKSCVEFDYNAWIVRGDEANGERRGEHHVTLLPSATKLQVTSNDFDDDGLEELFLGFDVSRGPQPLGQPCLWTQRGEYGVPGVAASNPPWTCKRALDHDKDGKLDVVSYGPFVAALTSECGAKHCPPRIAGPELIGHNVDGRFSFNDSVAQTARREACPNDARLIGPAADDLIDTSKRVACAKLQGVAPEAIVTALEAHKAELCVRDNCPAYQTLMSWAKAPLPPSLGR